MREGLIETLIQFWLFGFWGPGQRHFNRFPRRHSTQLHVRHDRFTQYFFWQWYSHCVLTTVFHPPRTTATQIPKKHPNINQGFVRQWQYISFVRPPITRLIAAVFDPNESRYISMNEPAPSWVSESRIQLIPRLYGRLEGRFFIPRTFRRSTNAVVGTHHLGDVAVTRRALTY